MIRTGEPEKSIVETPIGRCYWETINLEFYLMTKILILILLLLCNYFPIIGQTTSITNSKANQYIDVESQSLQQGWVVNIVNRIPVPMDVLMDIAYDGKDLLVGGYYGKNIFKLSVIDGSILDTISINSNSIVGLTFDGNSVWIADMSHQIHQIDTANGNVISSFQSPVSTDDIPSSLAWNGNNLCPIDIKWDFLNDKVSLYEIDTSGNLIGESSIFGATGTGITWDGNNFWYVEGAYDEVFLLDSSDNKSIIYRFDVPGGAFPSGLAWDGQYLWCGNADSDSLYQLEISNVNNVDEKNSIVSKDYRLFPNPFKDFTSVNYSNPFHEQHLLSLFDLTGKLLLTIDSRSDQIIIERNNLTSGLYFFRLQSESKDVRSGKLVVE